MHVENVWRYQGMEKFIIMQNTASDTLMVSFHKDGEECSMRLEIGVGAAPYPSELTYDITYYDTAVIYANGSRVGKVLKTQTQDEFEASMEEYYANVEKYLGVATSEASSEALREAFDDDNVKDTKNGMGGNSAGSGGTIYRYMGEFDI